MENKNIRYIIDNIISKAKYNEETNTYEIKEEDYLYLNLTTNQKKLLKKMCKNLGIKLEYTSYNHLPLPSVEDETIFEEYNHILDKLETDITDEEKTTLEQRRIELRNKIATDNIVLIDAVIKRRIDKNNIPNDIDDIYQTSYEILLEYIDKNRLKKDIFKNHISKLLLLYTRRRILNDNEGLGLNTKNNIEEINRAKDIKENIDIEQLSKELNLSRKRIEELININSIISPLSIEEQISIINSKEYNDDSVLYDDTFEKQLIDKQRKEIILKIIKTLPKIEQEMLILYYGLNGISYTEQEIGNMYGTTRSYISFIITKALDTIKTSIRVNHLKEIYEVPDTYQEIEQTSNKDFEEFLIRNLSKKTIEFLIPYLEKDIQEFLKLYTTYHNYKLKELSQALNISVTGAYKLKLKTLSSIKHIILTNLNQNSSTKTTYEEYLNYLMYLYLNNGKIKRKVL